MTDKKEKKVGKNKVIGAWSGAISSIIFWAVLGYFVVDWAWWIYLLMIMSISSPLKITFNYFTVESIKCPNCGNRMDKNSQFCNSCGLQLKTQCPNCGLEIKVGSRFCEKCGYNIYSNEGVNQKVNPQIEEDIPNYKFCPACGVKNPTNGKFCESCGFELK